MVACRKVLVLLLVAVLVSIGGLTTRAAPAGPSFPKMDGQAMLDGDAILNGPVVSEALACEPVSEVDFTWSPLTPTVGQSATWTASIESSAGWLTTTIGDDSAAWYHSLALDAADLPHISYYTYDGMSHYMVLAYARYDGSSWYTETIDSGGEFNSIALDAAGLPRISYYEGFAYDVKYAWFDGTTWYSTTVDSGDRQYYGAYTSLALDAAGQPHMTYLTNVGNGELRYAFYDGSAWVIQVVDPNVGMDTLQKSYTSLVLDAGGLPHIGYYDSMGGHLKYAWHDGAAWHTEIVDSAYHSGQYPSLALDSAGRPHISYYYEGIAGELRYASYDGSAWNIEILDSGDYSTGLQTSLALDSSDHPHIVYIGNAEGLLMYAWNEGTGWQFQPVADVGIGGGFASGGFPSLALNAADQPRMSYVVGLPGILSYAWLAAPPSPPISYDWSFGDGTLAVGQVVTHNYSLPGVYTVIVTATNCSGVAVTANHTITVVGPRIVVSPVPEVTLPPSGTATGTLTLSNAGVESLSWEVAEVSPTSWLDETPLSGTLAPGDATPVLLAYTAPLSSGRYTTTLRVSSNDPLYPQVDVPVVLAVPPEWCEPVTILTVTQAISGCQVTFGAELTGTAPYSYSWDFGPFGTSAEPGPSVDFVRSGEYTYSLASFNCLGICSDTLAGALTVECASPTWNVYLPLVLKGLGSHAR